MPSALIATPNARPASDRPDTPDAPDGSAAVLRAAPHGGPLGRTAIARRPGLSAAAVSRYALDPRRSMRNPAGVSLLPRTIALRVARKQSPAMDAQHKATIRGAAARQRVNAFRAHHFTGLRCSVL